MKMLKLGAACAMAALCEAIVFVQSRLPRKEEPSRKVVHIRNI
jgi:hypothetical protein